MLIIDPEECIDCALCEPECPVNAIYAEDDVPPEQQAFIEINARLSLQWPEINTKKDAPADADDWKDTKNKRHLLEE